MISSSALFNDYSALFNDYSAIFILLYLAVKELYILVSIEDIRYIKFKIWIKR